MAFRKSISLQNIEYKLRYNMHYIPPQTRFPQDEQILREICRSINHSSPVHFNHSCDLPPTAASQRKALLEDIPSHSLRSSNGMVHSSLPRGIPQFIHSSFKRKWDMWMGNAVCSQSETLLLDRMDEEVPFKQNIKASRNPPSRPFI